MNKNFKHLLSTILGALFYFICNNDMEEENHISDLPTYIQLTNENFEELVKGEWTIITSKNECILPEGAKHNHYNLAILCVNSIKQAEIAAKLRIKDPKEKTYLKNGEFTKDGLTYKINRPIPFSEALDIYVYYWALEIKRDILTTSSYELIFDRTISSFSKVVREILYFYVQG